MTPTREDTRDSNQLVRDEDLDREPKPRPWTAPDFVEHSTCAEIGAYSFHEK
jgi:hypothetical protein